MSKQDFDRASDIRESTRNTNVLFRSNVSSQNESKENSKNSDLLAKLLNLENNNQEIANEIEFEDVQTIQHKSSKSEFEIQAIPNKFHFRSYIGDSKPENKVK